MGLGTTELILILVIVLVLFGAKKLPDLAAGLAKGIKSFRTNIVDDKEESVKNESENKIEESSKAEGKSV